jgi:hypothetical protein
MKTIKGTFSHPAPPRVAFLIRLFGTVTICLLFSGLPPFENTAAAQDLAVEWANVDPSEGLAGDTVTLQASIKNNGPGMALAIQYQWVLSTDAEITLNDSAVTPVMTSYDYLYAGEHSTFSDVITIPSFWDPVAPSYFGIVIVDELGLLFDNDPTNDIGSTPFTFTGDPPHGFYDTVGDNYLDAIHLAAGIAGGSLNVTISFSEPVQTTVNLIMGIDLDQNPTTTGNNTSLPGTEAMVSLTYESMTAESVVTLQTDSGDTELPDAVAEGSSLSYSVPLYLLSGDAAMDLFWAIDHKQGPTADFDRAPDIGAYATDTETVVVRRPGDPTIQVAVADPVEGNYPDILQLDGSVAGDQLQLTLTYAHSVEVDAVPLLGDGLFVWVDLDSDGRLATGFANTGQTPPTMGIDHQLRLQIDDLAGIVPELLNDTDGDGEPEVFPMGLPFNDMFMRLDDTRIILKIPLAYLGHGDGAGALAVTSLDTRNILTGTIDRLPDSGAWDLANNGLLAAQTCLALPREVSDPADDSLGAFGYDNDELVHASICPGDQALLFAIDYESYLLSNNGATLIFLDTDRSAASGWAITNQAGDTTIGADYVLRSFWDDLELKQATHLYRTLAPETVQTAYQFATPTQANRLYLTLPLECIASPSGPVDILVKSASWGGGGEILLSNDDLPNSGVVTVATVPNALVGDLDGDGDVDGGICWRMQRAACSMTYQFLLVITGG